MKVTLIASCFLLIAFFTKAHPGVGIVQDSKGNIYYTDLVHVWKISPEGKKSIAIRNVHTHELYIDTNDDIYGEHLWYNGERLDTWGYYVWCLRHNGKLDTVEGPNPGFREDYSFNRDAAGNHYWAESFTTGKIKKKTPSGEITTLTEGKFKEIRWMHVTAEGIVYLVHDLNLYRIDQKGNKTLVVEGLATKPGSLSLDDARHSIMGIWTDVSGNVFAAVASARTVKKISPAGKVSDLVYSLTPWSPCGGLIDKKGNLWLMEYSITNDVRVRLIDKKELSKPPSKMQAISFNYFLPLTIAASVFLIISISVKKLLKK
ncbi:MAG: hypothetical protein ACXWCZ_07320 [Flavisolibacter sp.]